MSTLTSAILTASFLAASSAAASDAEITPWIDVQSAISAVVLDEAPCNALLFELGVCVRDGEPLRDNFACTGDPRGFLGDIAPGDPEAAAARTSSARSVIATLSALNSSPPPPSVRETLNDAVQRDQAIRQWNPPEWSAMANAVKWTFACAHGAYGARIVEHAISQLSFEDVERDEAVASDLWLLSQHVDHDPGFQERMASYFRQSNAPHMLANAAFLTDRHRQWRGLPQIYGTQFRCIDGAWRPFNLADADTVDERRAANGLGPIAEAIGGSAFSACGAAQ